MFQHRIRKVREKLSNGKIDAVLIADVANIAYLTGFANFSQNEREAYLFITKNEQFIITDARYSEAVKREIPHFQLFERSYNNPEEKLFKDLKNNTKILGIEEDVLTVAEHKVIKKYFQTTKHIDIKEHRAVKTAQEINKITAAAKLADQAFSFILKKIKSGISEKQLADKLEYFIKKNGGGLAFPTIVAFGKNSAVPHHQTGQTKFTNKEGQVILLDFGVKLNNYNSDMTRTLFFGKPSRKQVKIYQTVLGTQQKAVDFINSLLKKGQTVRAAEVDKIARDYLVSQGYPTIPHSLGHGIGLEVHECPHLSPESKENLKERMVFSVEPGIYLENFGGVRIEDLYYCEKENLKQITNASKELITV